MKQPCRLCAIKPWLLFGLMIGIGFSAFAVEFEIEGKAVCSLYAYQYFQESWTNCFTASVRGQEWRVVTWHQGSSNLLECCWDAHVLRTIQSFPADKANIGFVQPREHPTDEDQTLQVVWLAYCSSAYLQSVTNGRIEPSWNMDNPRLRKEGFTLAAKWTPNKLPPSVPSELFFISDGIYHGFDQKTKQPVETVLPVPYNAGYTCAVFKAAAFTNLNNICLPAKFYFSDSQTPLKNITPDMPRVIVAGGIESIKPQCSIDVFRPTFQGEASIYDHCAVETLPTELRQRDFVAYKAYDSDWPGGDELKELVRKYAKQLTLRAKLRP